MLEQPNRGVMMDSACIACRIEFFKECSYRHRVFLRKSVVLYLYRYILHHPAQLVRDIDVITEDFLRVLLFLYSPAAAKRSLTGSTSSNQGTSRSLSAFVLYHLNVLPTVTSFHCGESGPFPWHFEIRLPVGPLARDILRSTVARLSGPCGCSVSDFHEF